MSEIICGGSWNRSVCTRLRTRIRNAIPPKSNDWKASVSPRSKTDRNPKTSSKFCTSKPARSFGRERNFSAGDVPVRSEYLPGQLVLSWLYIACCGCDHIGDFFRQQWKSCRGSIRADEPYQRSCAVNAHIKLKRDVNFGASEEGVWLGARWQENWVTPRDCSAKNESDGTYQPAFHCEI